MFRHGRKRPQTGNGRTPAKTLVRKNTGRKWLNDRHCAQHVSAELIEHYALSAARLIQCERAISTYGFLAKNSQGNAITSPYITIAQTYMKQANTLWAMIYSIMKENCSTDYSGATPQDDVMERLLSTRRGG